MRAKPSQRSERELMARALALASLGLGTTSPNPLVGAIVARGGRVVGQGFHQRAGSPHAEILALREAGARARDATLFTNLEPCCHTGRTPPCVDEILRAGIRRVVAAMRDPDRRVNGRGFQRLGRHGVEISEGVLSKEAARLNRAFIKMARQGLPWVTLKGAASLDGRIATRTGDSKWITSEEAREHARLLRREHDAVMVGIGTVLADDPRLNARPRGSRKTPLVRVILDTGLRFPPSSSLVATLDEGPVVVFTAADAPGDRERRLTARGVEVRRVPLDGEKPDLRRVLSELGASGVTRVLVEGGGELHAAFLERGLADHLILYLAPRLVGGRDARSLVGGTGPERIGEAAVLERLSSYRVGRELLVEADIA